MNAELRAAWKHRELRILIVGDGVSTFGSLVSRLALPWTAARELGQGTMSVGLVFLVELLPAAVFGLFAGALVDRAGCVVCAVSCGGSCPLARPLRAWACARW